MTGVRNPFRIDVDAETGTVSWGDYGPDAGAATPTAARWATSSGRSPPKPINGGWPYCHGPNANYNEWNYATSTPGSTSSTARPARRTTRTWNTGLAQLPPAVAPQLYYGDRGRHQPWPG